MLSQIRAKANEEYAAAEKAKTNRTESLDRSILKDLSLPKFTESRCACCLDSRPAPTESSTQPSGTKLSADEDMVYCVTCDTVTETIGGPSYAATTATAMRGEEEEGPAAQSATDDDVDREPDSSPSSESPVLGDNAVVPEECKDSEVSEESEENNLATGATGAEVLCRNFRELLWYWQEYYLRRGRDRLSIEFSVHLPFRYWQSVVGKSFSII